MLKLDDFELENMEDCLENFQQEFNIEFQDSELNDLKTFEEFCALAISKISLEDSQTCTSQMVFYKLRNALLEARIISSRNDLAPATPVHTLFPRKNRALKIKIFNEKMGVKVHITEVPQWIVNLLVGLLALSLFMFLINWLLGLSAIVFTLLGFLIASNFKVLAVKNIADLVETIVTDHYMTMRSGNKTVNRSELKTVITHWFAKNAFIDKHKLLHASFE